MRGAKPEIPKVNKPLKGNSTINTIGHNQVPRLTQEDDSSAIQPKNAAMVLEFNLHNIEEHRQKF